MYRGAIAAGEPGARANLAALFEGRGEPEDGRGGAPGWHRGWGAGRACGLASLLEETRGAREGRGSTS